MKLLDFFANRRNIRNLIALAGLAISATGLWWLSPAWCLVLVGLSLATGAITGMWLDRPEETDD